MDTNQTMNKKVTLFKISWAIFASSKLSCSTFCRALLAGFFLSVSLLSTVATAKEEPLDQVVAVVNDDVIMQSELNNRLKQVEKQIEQRHFKLPTEDLLKKQVLDLIVVEDLQIQLAKKQGIRISDIELNHAIESIAARNKMSISKFKESLASEGLTYSDFREKIYREMLIARIQQIGVLHKIQVTDQDIRNYLSSAEGKTNKKYHLAHILVATPDNASSDDIKKSSEKAEAIYTELTKGKASFGNIAITQSQGLKALKGGDLGWRETSDLPDLFIRTAEKLKINQVSRPVRDPSGFHIIKLLGEKGAEQHFQTQYKVRHILIAPNEVRTDIEAHEIAQKLYKQLENNGNFSELAKSYSDDSASSLSSGNMGWVTPDSLVPNFAKEIEKLPLDTYSKPFKSKYGWHIAEVLNKRKKDISKKMQQAEVREVLAKRKFEEELPVWLRQLKSDAYIKEML